MIADYPSSQLTTVLGTLCWQYEKINVNIKPLKRDNLNTQFYVDNIS